VALAKSASSNLGTDNKQKQPLANKKAAAKKQLKKPAKSAPAKKKPKPKAKK
jgi:hypothetical protein